MLEEKSGWIKKCFSYIKRLKELKFNCKSGIEKKIISDLRIYLKIRLDLKF